MQGSVACFDPRQVVAGGGVVGCMEVRSVRGCTAEGGGKDSKRIVKRNHTGVATR